MVSGSIAGLVLAAGAASRFGALKQNHRIDGQTMLGRTVDALAAAGCKPIFVVTGADAESLENDWRSSGVSLVHNRAWRDGMSGSIACGVDAVLKAAGGVAALIVSVCDQPKLDAAVVRRLIDRFSGGEESAVASEYAGCAGVPAIFGASWFGRLRALQGDEGARKLLRGSRPVAAIPWPAGAIDLDRPADLDRLD